MATFTEPVARPEIHQTLCFIDGQWQPSQSGKTFETRHPANEEVITQIAEGDAADVDLAVKAARNAFDHGPWRSMDARERGALLYRLADLIEEEIDELAALETLDISMCNSVSSDASKMHHLNGQIGSASRLSLDASA